MIEPGPTESPDRSCAGGWEFPAPRHAAGPADRPAWL